MTIVMRSPRALSIISEASVETTLSGDSAESCLSSADSVAEGRLSDDSAQARSSRVDSVAEVHLSDDSAQGRFPSEESLAAVFPNDDASGSAKRVTRGERKRWRRRVGFGPE